MHAGFKDCRADIEAAFLQYAPYGRGKVRFRKAGFAEVEEKIPGLMVLGCDSEMEEFPSWFWCADVDTQGLRIILL